MRTFFCLLLSLIFAQAHAFERQFQCKVVGVSDGDTFTCLFDRTPIKVRLLHVDAPESAQPYGNRAKQALANLIFKQTVWLHSTGYDRYQRLLAVVQTVQGENINLAMVKQGMAWAYQKTEPQYEVAQANAQVARVGLWQDPAPLNPADWRKQLRSVASSAPFSPTQAVKKAENFANASATLNCQIQLSCKQIGDYALAKRYFQQCGWKTLDGNHDGIPCNKLYRQAQARN